MKKFVLLVLIIFMVSSVSFAFEKNGMFHFGFGIKNLSLDIPGEDSATLYGGEIGFNNALVKADYGNLDMIFNIGYYVGSDDVGYSKDVSINDTVGEFGIGYSKLLLNDSLILKAGILGGYEYVSFDGDGEDGFIYGVSGDIAYKVNASMFLGVNAKVMKSSNDVIDKTLTYNATLTFLF